MKIDIKKINGELLFSLDIENNSISKTINEYLENHSDLRYADLCSADLRHLDLRHADLRSANLHYANLRYSDLRSANLCSADLRSSDLRYSDLRQADLHYANLRHSDLSSANLSSADLSSADLCYANLDKQYLSISCIGSAKRMTTFCVEDNKIWCGCFVGSLKEFELEVRRVHTGKHLRDYLNAIAFFKTFL